VLAGTPYAGVIRIDDLSFAITSLFLAVELMHTLDPERETATALFTTFEALATIVQTILRPGAQTS